MTHKMPELRTSIVSIPDHEDAESIALAAAHAALEILAKVSADARGSTVLDRVQIVQPVSIGSLPGDALLDLMSNFSGHGPAPKYAGRVRCRVTPPKVPAPPPEDPKEGS